MVFLMATEVAAAKVGGPHREQLAVLDAVHRASPERHGQV